MRAAALGIQSSWQCIHALIRANDALTVRLLRRRSTRHEDAALLFGELVRLKKIPARFSNLRALLVRAVSEKSEYDYKGTEVSRDVAARWMRQPERFVARSARFFDEGLQSSAGLVRAVR